MKESEVQYVHFRVGEDLGLRLMEIAQEHLTERNNPIQALKTITESLGGCPVDIAVQILMGNMVLPVDVETQEVICQDRVAGEHDRFPRVDAIYYMKSRTGKILKTGEYLIDGLKDLQSEIKRNDKYFTISFKYEDLFKFIAGDDEILLNELRDNREVDGISTLFEVSKKFIEETMRTQATMEWMQKTCEEFKETENYVTYVQLHGELADILLDIAYHLNQTMKLNFVLDAPEDNVQKYLDAVQEIDIVLSKGIEPVDIMDNYSAGWLSPQGEYYALNGEIANMLHIQIASALQEKGIIPMYDNDRDKEIGIKQNPDAWLEQHGWVKIHGNNVQFGGNLNNKLDMPIVHITDKQIDIIRDYITDCHQCEIKAGWRLERTSIGLFTSLAMADKISLYKKYFDF